MIFFDVLIWSLSPLRMKSVVARGKKHAMPIIMSALVLMGASLLPASAFSPPSAHKNLLLCGRIHANGIAEGCRTGILAGGSLGARVGRRRAMMGLRMGAEEPSALRTMFGDKGGPPWACVNKCGACCYLAPKERDLDCLTEGDRELYTSMAGEDGWCINFDKSSHMCKIYEDRPGFCRIENLQGLYGVEDKDMGDFAMESCREHIGSMFMLRYFPHRSGSIHKDSVYGEGSPQDEAFEQLQFQIRTDAGWEEDEGDEDGEEVSVTGLLEVRIQVVEGLREKPGDKYLMRALEELDEAIVSLGGELPE